MVDQKKATLTLRLAQIRSRRPPSITLCTSFDEDDDINGAVHLSKGEDTLSSSVEREAEVELLMNICNGQENISL